ncbi:hypothetical protein B566_EDAN009642, partial [Ephemera danica]
MAGTGSPGTDLTLLTVLLTLLHLFCIMARCKQTKRKSLGGSSETSNRYKRATFKGQKKRDPTPEPSHPDNPCPSQVIGTDSGCNLCFPDIKCHPGERHVCRQIWAGEHFRTSKALQL